MTNSTADKSVSKPVPANKKLLSVSAPFGYDDHTQESLYRVYKNISLLTIANELMSAIGDCDDMLRRIKTRIVKSPSDNGSIDLSELKLMIARLDMAGGLALSIYNTIEDIEEGEDLSNE